MADADQIRLGVERLEEAQRVAGGLVVDVRIGPILALGDLLIAQPLSLEHQRRDLLAGWEWLAPLSLSRRPDRALKRGKSDVQ